MNRIRVALGDVHSAILRDILAQITQLEPDMELVGRVGQPHLREAVAQQDADVVICDVRPEELPDVCRELFANGDAPIVVGLAREGREAAVCIANAGAAQLMGVIRSAIAGAGAEEKVVHLAAPLEDDGEKGEPAPYPSNAECLAEHLRALDLALLDQIAVLETTIWDESVQRLQGLAISPGEVRALLEPVEPDPRQRHSGDLKRRRRLATAIEKRLEATLNRPSPPALAALSERFGLGPFERFAVVAALAPEIDRNKYGKAYALLQDDVTRRQPSLELLLRLYDGLDDDDRWRSARAFDRDRPLRRWSLLRLAGREVGDPATPFGRRVEIDDRISRFLLGLSDLGSPLDDVAVTGLWDLDLLRVSPPADAEDRLAALIDTVRHRVPGAPSRLVVHVHGRAGTGRRSLIAGICERLRLRIVRVDAARLAPVPPASLDEYLLLLSRESVLQPTALCLENIDTVLADDAPSSTALRVIAHATRGFTPVVFAIGQRPWNPEGLFGDGVFHGVALAPPEGDRARRIWAEELSEASLDAGIGGIVHAARELAARFALSPGQIRDVVANARTRALWERPQRPALSLQDLYRASRDQCSHRLAAHATPVVTGFGWDDLVLPDQQRSQLRELELAIRNARGVLGEWNFASRLPYGRGITALFSGQSGTGKTMAAGVLARELGLDLYKIDLSRVVSKYIGETEKNLNRIFEQAEDTNAMLFFDEADALFGKRSAIKDAHDRYANIEIAYLLQKMEEREGVTVLATNFRTNMDDAFFRRIRFSIEFPMPEYAQRLEIWRGSLPAATRLAGDVDLSILAKRLRVSGGSIMNVCLGAASLAFEPGGAIHMRHLLHAAKRELEKLGQQYNEDEFASEALVGAVGDRRRGGS